ncbi:MAG TPA: alkaline phosphatase PhoX [Nocardioidaceae bacterium]|nr:alkaline phosphatase PhoX [Nocardioidaceae bacterium]
MTMQRRSFIKLGAGAALAGGPFAGFVNSPTGAVETPAQPVTGLRPAKDLRDGKVRLYLPEGFKYRSFHDTSEPVTLPDGTELPGRHDGMGAFDGDNGMVTLVRNHEVNSAQGAFGPDDAPRYDAAAGGGTTTVDADHKGIVADARTSLSGTLMNCSGGIMPWGSWITCEETVNGPDVGPDYTGRPNTGLEQPHGYIFEVPARGVASAEPIRSAGRFCHEAVSWDGEHLYLTEDNFGFASGFYRYSPPNDPAGDGRIEDGGTLEMLKVADDPNAHLEASFERGRTFDVEWVLIDSPDPDYSSRTDVPSNNEALTYVSSQGWAKGAAYFSRLEGQVYDADEGVVYFTSTQGGGKPEDGTSDPSGYGNGNGQVWAYNPTGSTLTLVYESPGPRNLDFPDNITSREGTLVICEDGDQDNYVRALRPDGTMWNLAWNRMREGSTDRTDDEFAGSTFSTDGETLFVNIQSDKGLTFAIWGPWDEAGF